jgi:membrane associated rhomboid family serine protease
MFNINEKQKETIRNIIEFLPLFRTTLKIIILISIGAGISIAIYALSTPPVKLSTAIFALIVPLFGSLLLTSFFKAAEKFILARASQYNIPTRNRKKCPTFP